MLSVPAPKPQMPGRSTTCVTPVAAALLLHPGVAMGGPAVPPVPPPAPSGQIVQVSTLVQLQNAVASIASNTTIVIGAGTYNLATPLYINGSFTNVGIRGAQANAKTSCGRQRHEQCERRRRAVRYLGGRQRAGCHDRAPDDPRRVLPPDHAECGRAIAADSQRPAGQRGTAAPEVEPRWRWRRRRQWHRRVLRVRVRHDEP